MTMMTNTKNNRTEYNYFVCRLNTQVPGLSFNLYD